jgi:hypothetical protein
MISREKGCFTALFGRRNGRKYSILNTDGLKTAKGCFLLKCIFGNQYSLTLKTSATGGGKKTTTAVGEQESNPLGKPKRQPKSYACKWSSCARKFVKESERSAHEVQCPCKPVKFVCEWCQIEYFNKQALNGHKKSCKQKPSPPATPTPSAGSEKTGKRRSQEIQLDMYVGDVEEGELQGMTVSQLRELCRSYKLPCSGLKKKELIQSLSKHLEHAESNPTFDINGIHIAAEEMRQSKTEMQSSSAAANTAAKAANKAADAAVAAVNAVVALAAEAKKNQCSEDSNLPTIAKQDSESWMRSQLEGRDKQQNFVTSRLFAIVEKLAHGSCHDSQLVPQSIDNSKQSAPSQLIDMCEECSKQRCTLKCDECGLLFCEACSLEVHSIGSLKKHSVHSALCEKCGKVPFSVKCVECDLCYCSTCSVARHSKGNFTQHVLQKL